MDFYPVFCRKNAKNGRNDAHFPLFFPADDSLPKTVRARQIIRTTPFPRQSGVRKNRLSVGLSSAVM
jgi:hypothetical protein